MSDRQCIPGSKEAFKQDHIPDAEPNCTLAERDAAIEAMRQRCIFIIEESPTVHKHRPDLCYCEICTYVRGNVTEIRALPGGDHALRLALARQAVETAREIEETFNEAMTGSGFAMFLDGYIYKARAAVAAIEKEK